MQCTLKIKLCLFEAFAAKYNIIKTFMKKENYYLL